MTCSTRQPGLSGEQEFPFRSDLNRSEKKKYPKQDSYKTDFLHLSSSLRGAHGTSQFECIRQQLQTNSFPRRDFDLQLSTPANPFPPLTETRRDETRRDDRGNHSHGKPRALNHVVGETCHVIAHKWVSGVLPAKMEAGSDL